MNCGKNSRIEENINSMENIKNALLISCNSSHPEDFKPNLASQEVTCGPDKEDFCRFFECILSVSRGKSIENYCLIFFPNKDSRKRN